MSAAISRTFAVVCLLMLATGCSKSPSDFPKVIVFGVDGMDPRFVERHWDMLPNLRGLRDSGGFRRLKTTNPPQSPVAWSTFITGLDPAGHGIYDFVHRDPKTLAPYSSMDRTEPPRFSLSLGEWRVPLSKAHVVSLRHGEPFWKRLADRGVPVTTIRMPTNYPPLKAGAALAGMGVPDLAGGFGTFTLFTDDPEEITRTVAGGRINKVRVTNGRATLTLDGPPNSLRNDERVATVPITVDVDSDAKAARVAADGSVLILNEGEWSGWIPVRFGLLSTMVTAPGMVRIYAKQLTPRLLLYVTPVNVDPRDPALPIASPARFGLELAHAVGPFYTQGIAEDTSALRQRVFDLQEYLAQSRLVFDDERRLLRYTISRFHGGLLFFYFSVVDQNSHVLWGRHDAELLETYRAVDEAIGEAMRAEPDSRVLVMSDHGFSAFDRGFQLNAWLAANGFLALSGPAAREGFVNVDWSRTQAYGLGLNGVYVNLRGREARGIVDPRERSALIRRIGAVLLAYRDPKTGAQVVRSVTEPPESSTAPDLIVGYRSPYRASWDTALGATEGPLVQANNDAWIGDHCIDPGEVPGVLLSNRAVDAEQPSLGDVTAMVLRAFGVR